MGDSSLSAKVFSIPNVIMSNEDKKKNEKIDGKKYFKEMITDEVDFFMNEFQVIIIYQSMAKKITEI